MLPQVLSEAAAVYKVDTDAIAAQGQAGVRGQGEGKEREESTGEGSTGQAEKDSLSEQKIT